MKSQQGEDSSNVKTLQGQMTTAQSDDYSLKAKQAKLLDQLQQELADTKAHATSIENMKAQQVKILGDYSKQLAAHGASKKLIESLQTEQSKLETELKTMDGNQSKDQGSISTLTST